jgi:hypothetical protein
MTLHPIAAVLVVLAWPAAALAQNAPERIGRPLLLVGLAYDRPLRTAAGLGILIPFGAPDTEDHGVLSYPGVLVEAGAGAGGRRIGFGLASRVKDSSGPVLFGVDVLMALRWTAASPRSASANATYIGAEAGLLLLAVRVSAGVARRIEGPSGPHRTIATWRVGVQTGW